MFFKYNFNLRYYYLNTFNIILLLNTYEDLFLLLGHSWKFDKAPPPGYLRTTAIDFYCFYMLIIQTLDKP